MGNLALNDSLIDEYIKYKFQSNFDLNKIRRLLKFIQPFDIRSDHPSLQDPAMPIQLNNDPLINIIPPCGNEELVQNSLLKLMLIDNTSSYSFVTLNIMSDYEKIKLRFGGMYPNNLDKNKAQLHIKALLSDARWIKISDSYIDNDASQWNENKNLLMDIVPYKTLDLTIESGSVRNSKNPLDGTKKEELKSICRDWNVIGGQYNDNSFHDRYIETDKLKILLSSGLYNLSSGSNKDFTYIVEIK